MTPFESTIKEAVLEWATSIINSESEFISLVEENIRDGNGLETVAYDFISQYVDFDTLVDYLTDSLNDLLDKLDIEVHVSWKERY